MRPVRAVHAIALDATMAWLAVALGCGGGGDGEDSGSADTTSGAPTSSTTAAATTGEATGSTGETTAVSGGSDTAPAPCMGFVPGEWGDCIDAAGQVDLAPCMAEEMPEVGTLFCLVSSGDPMAGACTILSCEDDCDCFAMPATGNVVPRCNRFTETGKACALPCAEEGAVCPDGMECMGGLCYWPDGGGGTAGDSSSSG